VKSVRIRGATALLGAAAVLVAGPAAASTAPAPASVRVRGDSITVPGSITELKADAGRAIVLANRTATCADVLVWSRSRRKVVTVFDHRRCSPMVPLESFYGVALAGDRAAYVATGGGNVLESTLLLMPLATRGGAVVAHESAEGQGSFGRTVSNTHGEGGLLAYNDHELELCRREPAVSPPDVPCPAGVEDGSIVLVSDQVRLAYPTRRVIASSSHELRLLAVGGGRVVARTAAGDVVVLAPRRPPAPLVSYPGFRAERLVARYPYEPGEPLAAATDGRTLVVLRAGALDVIPLPGGAGVRRTWRLPGASGYGPDRPVTCGDYGTPRACLGASLRLTDLDGSVAVFVQGHAVHLLDVRNGRGAVAARPSAGPVTAQLEPDGLYVAAGSTVTFTPRREVERSLRRWTRLRPRRGRRGGARR
jgi:hypothetical protein